jgi:hypothetical protein
MKSRNRRWGLNLAMAFSNVDTNVRKYGTSGKDKIAYVGTNVCYTLEVFNCVSIKEGFKTSVVKL